MQKFSITNLFFSLIAILHFFLVFIYCEPYCTNFSLEQKIIFFSTNIISFILIYTFWNYIPKVINIIKSNNNNKKFFIKNFLLYFLFNIIVLAMTYPTGSRDVDFLICYNEILHYNLYWWISHLINIDIIIGYHIIPTIWGISVFNLFIYSIIFSYIITNIKKYISEKYYWLLYIPFCIPSIFIINQNVIRLVLCSWIFIFLTCFILFNQKKEINNNIVCISMSILTFELIISRFEFLPLIIIIPLIIYTLKIFKIKKFIIYTLIIFILSGINFYVQNISNTKTEAYLANNCGHIFKKFFSFNVDNNEIINIKKKIETIYPTIYIDKNIDNNYKSELTKEEIKNLYTSLNFVIKKYPHLFIKNNLKELILTSQNNPLEDFNTNKIDLSYDIGFGYYIPEEIIPKTQKQNKISSLLLYGTTNYTQNKISKILYNPLINIAILLILLIGGLISKKYIYTYISITWTILLIILLLTIPFIRYLYFWGLIFNSNILLFIFIINILNENKKSTDNKLLSVL